MADGSWSWSTAWDGSTPEIVGKPRYAADAKTCLLTVKLEPNKTYAWWLNSSNFHNFRDRQGHSAALAPPFRFPDQRANNPIQWLLIHQR